MKKFLKIILILSLVVNTLYFIPAFKVFHSITKYPGEWQGGIDTNSTLSWFVVITLGYGYLSLQSLLAVLGLLFGFRYRKAAYWFFIVPGFIGILLALIWLVMFILFDVEFPASWQVIAIPFISPVIAYITGRFSRKKVIPKKS